jgi:hypothetical protein
MGQLPSFDFRGQEVHGSSPPFGTTRLSAVDFRNQFPHVSSLGQVMTVGAMGAKDIIFFAERRADSYGYSFFSGIEVDRAKDFPTENEVDKALFADPDAHHLPIKVQVRFFRIRIHFFSGGWRRLFAK